MAMVMMAEGMDTPIVIPANNPRYLSKILKIKRERKKQNKIRIHNKKESALYALCNFWWAVLLFSFVEIFSFLFYFFSLLFLLSCVIILYKDTH